ncbi:MAG: Txe/YoeB family addiction module toxin [Spirochaetota bacterium]
MKLVFSSEGWVDYLSWQDGDRKALRKVNALIGDIIRDPETQGIGKSELLKGELSGYRPRRISGEHRRVYQLRNEELIVMQCRFHY